MVVISPEPAALAENLELFFTTDELLCNSPVLIFYGPTTTATTTTQATNSRIQAHVFTPAGLQNYARLIISPTATFYNAVTCLPRQEQGEEICRGLAFSLYKYFVELPQETKTTWERRHASTANLPSAPKLFSEAHAAIVAARMAKVTNVADAIADVRHALGEQTLSWLDLDVVLPRGSIQKLESRESGQFDELEDDVDQQRYGQYAPIVKLFGEAAFLPTSKLRRAPSKPTSLNRSQSFSRKQKETLRREMCELLDTEENYVSKVHELVNTVAVEFREKAKLKSTSSSSPTEQALRGLFPPSLDKILEVNSQFLEALRVILEETENGAITDIEQSTDDVFIAPLRGQKDPPDVTGAAAVAKACIEWFPQFGDCYTEYMAAHGDFSQLLKLFTKDTNSSFSKRVCETGEQKLTSMLIEPVQRLPRYNLYIDNIIKQLPVRHPAIKAFLKARDIVSDICTREGPTAQQIRVCDRLRKMTSAWPNGFNPQGRLIAAVDCVELAPPFNADLNQSFTGAILVLFTDFLVILHKLSETSTNARGLLAELDNPKFSESFSEVADLAFYQQLSLSDVFLTEHDNGHTLQLLAPCPAPNQASRPRSRERKIMGIRMFYLQGIYEGKAQRAVEEFAKACVEGRFPEAEREGHKWDVRSLPGDLSYFTSVSEEAAEQKIVEGRKAPARIQILVDSSSHSQLAQAGNDGIELTVSISLLDEGFFQMDTVGILGYAARDKLTTSEFLPVLTKRLSNFFHLRNSVKNPMVSEAYLLRNQQVLNSLTLLIVEDQEDQGSKSRSHSPVKMLSSFFGASVGQGGSRKLQRNAHTVGDVPRLAPPLQAAPTRTHSFDSDMSRPASSSKSVAFSATPITDPNGKIEETLENLILALHARKGNIVGRSVRARAVADELIVNELYNSLLENPANLDLAGQSSVDVLFAVFEKFLQVAWKERMGPVLSHATFVSLQMRSDSMPPGEFEDYFRVTFNQLMPANQRALRAIMHLLAELLDGTSNDGDRGVLTAAFAEMLVPAGNANDFISLMDRLVQDVEALIPIPMPGVSTPNFGSMDSRYPSAVNGSISSNTSLRKRFGFGTLTRENSKSESESKVGSLWRSLSKNSHGYDGQPLSPNKVGPPPMNRSNSTDAGRISPKRPSSRDRPTVLGAFNFENGNAANRPFVGGLGTIGEVPPTVGPPRKKRRSSLSDLKTIHDANHVPSWSPQTPGRPGSKSSESSEQTASPRTPLRTSIGSSKHTSSIPAPTRLGSPMRKDTSPSTAVDRVGSMRRRALTVKEDSKDKVTVKTYSPVKRRGESVSSIPNLKSLVGSGLLLERPGLGNAVKLPPSTPRSPTKAGAPVSPPKRLRMQSPQKLRERLQTQQRDIDTASQDLQNELSAIGQELNARSNSRLGQSIGPPSTPGANTSRPLESRIASLEKHLKATLDALSSRSAAISNDVSTSLQVSEARFKHLDQSYREVNAENEALYSRFNEELEKVTAGVRKGKAAEEIERRLKASEEEAVRLRKENSRLKREVAGLKAQIRE